MQLQKKKLMNYCIRNIPEDKSIMIYSPDADVILLCMLLNHKNIYVIEGIIHSIKKNNIKVEIIPGGYNPFIIKPSVYQDSN